MKKTQNIGISLFLLGLLLFISILFLGKYQVTSKVFDNVIKENNGCVIVCNNNLDLGKVQQIKIDIKKFEDWFEKPT